MAIKNPFRNMTKPQLYATIAGSAGVGGYLLYRHHKTTGSWNPFSAGSSSSTTSATTSSTSIDPVTGLPYSQDNAIDPVTGLTYLAEAQQYGSIAVADASVSQFGTTATSGGTTITGTPQPNGTVSGSTNPPGSPYTSNAGWSQAVQAGLTDIGYDGPTVAAALGLYLTGQPMTAAQASIVNAGIAEFGPPPVGTFQVILAPASGTGTTTGTSSGSAPKTAPSGLSSTGHAGFADFGWGVVSGATGYELQVSGTGGKGTGTSGLDESFTGNHAANVKLNPGTYKAQVRATNTTGSGPWASFPNFTVTK